MFVLLTPVHNELDLIDELANCVLNSSLRPDLWQIIDDASNDGSEQKLKQLAEQHEFIRLKRLEKQPEYMGFHISEVFQAGVEAAHPEIEKADYIGFLDADIRFAPAYWQRLKRFLEQNPDVGIVSGVLCAKNARGQWQVEPFQRKDNPRGGLRLVRGTCFRQIGGVPYSRAWDPVMNVKARIRGWRVVTLSDLFAASVRPTDQRFDLKSGELSRGQRDWHLHHPLLQILVRALFKSLKSKSLSGWYYLQGYLQEKRRGGLQLPDPAVREYYRKERTREWWRIVKARLLGGENPHGLIPQIIVPEEKIFV
ncbi:MAG: glycosyltransferase family 2 protein [Caldisericaceae bacterium]|nr:glycosyltransferase family 2 protein [Caldisericaceae bacterium]